MTEKGRVIDSPLSQSDYETMKLRARIWRDQLLLMFMRNTGFRPAEVVSVQANHLDRQGPAYLVFVKRAKKKKQDNPFVPVYLSPNLGRPLFEWVAGQKMQPSDPVFQVGTRQLRNIVEEAGRQAIGRVVLPKEFRRFYILTIAELAAQVIGWAPQHMEVAQKMVGHEHVNTTWDWYLYLPEDKKREIQERIPV